MSTPTATTPKTISVTTQKVDTQAEYQALIDGIGALMPGVDPFLLAKRTIARADLLAQFQKRIDAAKATKAARIALSASVAAEREVDAAVKPLRSAFKTFAQGRYGKTAPELQELGFVPYRKPAKSAQKKAAGVTKAAATRKSRGTKGRQQKAATPAASPAATGGTTAGGTTPSSHAATSAGTSSAS